MREIETDPYDSLLIEIATLPVEIVLFQISSKLLLHSVFYFFYGLQNALDQTIPSLV